MTLWVQLADARVALELPPGRTQEALATRLAHVAAAPGEPALRVEAHLTGTEAVLPPPGGQWPLPELQPLPGGEGRLAGDDYEATLSADRTSLRLEGPDAPHVLESALRVWLADRVARAGGLLVHGVGLLHAGRAALFTGQSGAGKSTLGRLWRESGGALLADELVAVLPRPGGGYEAWGTAWNEGSTRHAPLLLLGTLTWTPGHQLRPLPPLAVARTLLANVLLAEREGEERAAAVRRASALLGQVRPVQLAFALTPGVGDVLRAALGGA